MEKLQNQKTETPYFIRYEAWRMSFQTSEQAAQSAFKSLALANNALANYELKLAAVKRELRATLNDMTMESKLIRSKRLRQEHAKGMFQAGDGLCSIDDSIIGMAAAAETETETA